MTHYHAPIAGIHDDLFYLNSQTLSRALAMGWLRLVASLKLQVSLENIGLFCRALLQKRPMIWRSLLNVATPYKRVGGVSLQEPIAHIHITHITWICQQILILYASVNRFCGDILSRGRESVQCARENHHHSVDRFSLANRFCGQILSRELVTEEWGVRHLNSAYIHNIWGHTATHCNTLQHTATHCNIADMGWLRLAGSLKS